MNSACGDERNSTGGDKNEHRRGGRQQSLRHAGRTSGLVRIEPRGHTGAGEAPHRDSEVRSLDILQQASAELRSLHSRRVVEEITSQRDYL